MLLQSTIQQIEKAQKENLQTKGTGLRRTKLDELPDLSSHALIISGIRRCGKSTLLHQLLESKYQQAFYLNFEDPRLFEFERADFLRLDKVISESVQTLFFDEIQIIEDWERYVRQKLDEGYRVIITGSNASLLSRELGTKLTGRHITKELFPFSYQEFCVFRKLHPSEDTLKEYMKTGGFPEYVQTQEKDILNQLFEDILIRDIAVRYGIRDVKSLQRLALYLISNSGKLVTGNSIKRTFGIKATSTVMEYFSYLENAWLFHFVPRFSYSLKQQQINPRKVYSTDTGLINTNSISFSDDYGRIFENLIFLHLRRQHKEICYFSDKGECDFVICEKGTPLKAIQACYQLTQDNLDRELDGILNALENLNLNEGFIVTFNQRDRFERNGKVVEVVPGFEMM